MKIFYTILIALMLAGCCTNKIITVEVDEGERFLEMAERIENVYLNAASAISRPNIVVDRTDLEKLHVARSGCQGSMELWRMKILGYNLKGDHEARAKEYLKQIEVIALKYAEKEPEQKVY